jgi:hypothetical protein
MNPYPDRKVGVELYEHRRSFGKVQPLHDSLPPSPTIYFEIALFEESFTGGVM